MSRLLLTAFFYGCGGMDHIDREIEATRPEKVYLEHPDIYSLLRPRLSLPHPSRRQAQEWMDYIERTITLMDTADIVCSKSSLRDQLGRHMFDHCSTYRVGRRPLVVTQPFSSARANPLLYQGHAIPHWCRKNGWQCERRDEWSVLVPGKTALFLCAPEKGGADIAEIVRKLDAHYAERELQAAECMTQATWFVRSPK
jgi:hypothetical protein